MSDRTVLPTIKQGADYSLDLTRYWLCDGLPPEYVDMTGFAGILQLRRTPQSYPVVTLTQASGITFQGANGKIEIAVSGAETAAIPPGDYKFDLKVTSPSGEVERLLQGDVRVSAEISREL